MLPGSPASQPPSSGTGIRRVCEKLGAQVERTLPARFSGKALVAAIIARHLSRKAAPSSTTDACEEPGVAEEHAIHLASLLLREGVVVSRSHVSSSSSSSDQEKGNPPEFLCDSVARYVLAAVLRREESKPRAAGAGRHTPRSSKEKEKSGAHRRHGETRADKGRTPREFSPHFSRPRSNSDSPFSSPILPERRSSGNDSSPFASPDKHRHSSSDIIALQSARFMIERGVGVKKSPSRLVCEKMRASVERDLGRGFSGEGLRKALAKHHAGGDLESAGRLATLMVVEGVVLRVGSDEVNNFDLTFDDAPRYTFDSGDGGSFPWDDDRDSASTGSGSVVSGSSPRSLTHTKSSKGLRQSLSFGGDDSATNAGIGDVANSPNSFRRSGSSNSLFLPTVDDLFQSTSSSIDLSDTDSPVSERRPPRRTRSEKFGSSLTTPEQSRRRSRGLLRAFSSNSTPFPDETLSVELSAIKNCKNYEMFCVCDVLRDDSGLANGKIMRSAKSAFKRGFHSALFSKFKDVSLEIPWKPDNFSARRGSDHSISPLVLRLVLVEQTGALGEPVFSSSAKIVASARIPLLDTTPGERQDLWMPFYAGSEKIVELAVKWTFFSPVVENPDYSRARLHFTRLREMFFGESLEVALLLSKISSSDDLASAIIRLARGFGVDRTLVQTMADRHLKQLSEKEITEQTESGVWRVGGASSVTQLFRNYLLVALQHDFLPNVMQRFINRCSEEFSVSRRKEKRDRRPAAHVSVEIDPNKLTDVRESELKANRVRLIGLVTSFLETIFDSVDKFAEIRPLFEAIWKSTRKVFPGVKPEDIVGTLFFLRFSNAALISPSKFGLVAPNVDVNENAPLARSLMLVVKLSQLVANCTLDRDQISEVWLHPLIPALVVLSAKYRKFCKVLCSQPDRSDNITVVDATTQEEKVKLMAVITHYAQTEWNTLRDRMPASPEVVELSEILFSESSRSSEEKGSGDNN